MELEALRRDFGRKERDFQRVSEELAALKVDWERRERRLDLDRGRLEDELVDVQRELLAARKAGEICLTTKLISKV